MSQMLEKTIKQMSVRGKGILAADESIGTIQKRFDSIQIENTEEHRRAYRDMLFTVDDLNKYICGVICYEETLNHKTKQDKSLMHVLEEQGIVPGIKVDQGLIPLVNSSDEKTTQGLDRLPDRLQEYKKKGARFAKWRCVYDIDAKRPTSIAIETNAELLARYAAICQSEDIVPIVEPELLMDGSHTIERCSEASEIVFRAVFNVLARHHVVLEHMILKPSMVISGKECSKQADIDTVARETVKVLLRTVPASVPSINFLSGGQSAELATKHLNRMNQLFPNLPWNLSYSYGRALQDPSIKTWKGQEANAAAAQAALLKRAKLNSAAAKGEYKEELEQAV